MKLAPLADMWPQYPVGTPDDVATLVGGNCGDNITKYNWDSRRLDQRGRNRRTCSQHLFNRTDRRSVPRADPSSRGISSLWFVNRLSRVELQVPVTGLGI